MHAIGLQIQVHRVPGIDLTGPQQPIRVLIAAALPRAMGVAKVHLHSRVPAWFLEFRHLTAPAIGPALAPAPQCTRDGPQAHPLLPGYPVVDRIEGRRQEFIVCRDRRLISVNALTTTRYPDLEAAEAIQFEQSVPGQFTVKVLSSRPMPAAAAQRVMRAMAEKTGDGCRVSVTQVEHIARTARGKHQMLIQHLDLTSYFGASGGVQ